jgi:transcriptional regulator with XRE-family HTH domain
MEFNRIIVKVVEDRRRALGITGAEMALMLGVKPSQYSNIVVGRSNLSLDQMERAFRGLGLEMMVTRRDSTVDVKDGLVVVRGEGFPVNVSREWQGA